MIRDPEPCTTFARTRRHYSLDLGVNHWGAKKPGRRGTTLCGDPQAMDQEKVDYLAEAAGGTPVVVDSLRECPLCRNVIDGASP